MNDDGSLAAYLLRSIIASAMNCHSKTPSAIFIVFYNCVYVSDKMLHCIKHYVK